MPLDGRIDILHRNCTFGPFQGLEELFFGDELVFEGVAREEGVPEDVFHCY